VALPLDTSASLFLVFGSEFPTHFKRSHPSCITVLPFWACLTSPFFLITWPPALCTVFCFHCTDPLPRKIPQSVLTRSVGCCLTAFSLTLLRFADWCQFTSPYRTRFPDRSYLEGGCEPVFECGSVQPDDHQSRVLICFFMSLSMLWPFIVHDFHVVLSTPPTPPVLSNVSS